MKKQFLLLAILISPIWVFGQYIIEYDFCSGVITNPLKSVPTGQFVVLKIKNINTFRYNVAIKGVNINYVTPVPSELQALFRLPKESLTNEKQQEAVTEAQTSQSLLEKLSVSTKTKADSSSQQLSRLRSEKSRKNNELNKAKTKQNEAIELANSKTAKKPKDKSLELTEAKSKVTELTIEVKASKVKIEAAAEEDEKTKAFNDAVKQMLEATEKYVALAEKIADTKLSRAILIDLSKKSSCQEPTIQSQIPAINEVNMREDFKQFNSYYAKINSLHTTALATALETKEDEREDNVKIVNETKSLVISSYAKFNEDNFLDIIRDVSLLKNALENNSAYEVVSPPIQMDGDYVRFEATSTPVKLNDLMPIEAGKTMPFEVSASKGWKADFSVGPAFSFGKNSRDDNYDLRKETDTTSTLIKSGNKSVVYPAVVAMLHAYVRSGTQTNIGIMLGVGAGYKADDKVSASFYTGPTLVLGKHQKVMISAGASFLPVSRLKSIYSENNVYSTADLDVSRITEKVIKGSLFFSISYNLTNRIEVK